ncbi:MAG: SPASM domain-containing protein, partial [Desulfobulbaceae bacterium]|nr:SPASM domain-containing protein [Desulfobulbaceae bacterium]
HLSLHVLGEPLLHPELGALLALCRQRRLRVNLTTNGTLLARRQEMLLASPALRQINISLHSLPAQGGEAPMATYLAEVFAFVDRLQAETDIHACLRLWNEELAEAGKEAVVDDNPIHAAIEKHFALSGRLREIDAGRGITLAPRVHLSRAERFAWPHPPGPDLGERGICRGLKDHLAVLVDGTVVPCCLDGEGDIALGNILDQSLAEILAAPRAAAMLTAASRQRFEEPLCRRCSFRQRF